MLFLTFELGTDRYVIDTHDVVEVLARAPLKAIPSAPDWVAGLLAYRGRTVPVIDLSALALGRRASDSISTRMLVVNYDPEYWLGLIVERASRTVRLDPEAFVPSGVDTPDARWLGRVAHDADGMLQWVRIEHLLPPEVHASLFAQAHAS